MRHQRQPQKAVGLLKMASRWKTQQVSNRLSSEAVVVVSLSSRAATMAAKKKVAAATELSLPGGCL
jgi:hypothetical protein